MTTVAAGVVLPEITTSSLGSTASGRGAVMVTPNSLGVVVGCGVVFGDVLGMVIVGSFNLGNALTRLGPKMNTLAMVRPNASPMTVARMASLFMKNREQERIKSAVVIG